MKRGLLIVLALFVVSAIAFTAWMVVNVNKKSEEILGKFETIDKSLDLKSSDEKLDLAVSSANGVDFEFPELYSAYVNIIPDDKDENSILVQKLKAKGFRVTNWGRGNFMEGPRIVNYTLRKDFCECEVTKAYYSTEADTLYSVLESVKCSRLE